MCWTSSIKISTQVELAFFYSKTQLCLQFQMLSFTFKFYETFVQFKTILKDAT